MTCREYINSAPTVWTLSSVYRRDNNEILPTKFTLSTLPCWSRPEMASKYRLLAGYSRTLIHFFILLLFISMSTASFGINTSATPPIHLTNEATSIWPWCSVSSQKTNINVSVYGANYIDCLSWESRTGACTFLSATALCRQPECNSDSGCRNLPHWKLFTGGHSRWETTLLYN